MITLFAMVFFILKPQKNIAIGIYKGIEHRSYLINPSHNKKVFNLAHDAIHNYEIFIPL